ncbi:FtsX-like permease family protein [Comamonas flocculans]|uniref:FtsX-like permease family protein n=1 Tax=Comamonas flocculans TaxID=2597701 RepID=A0A5B8RQW0_9BURK|nr:FtsX-like permease family protein [Comamonas flocculans]QEA12020.1 FtsX-like permease family protein [Comamonas flocculans]
MRGLFLTFSWQDLRRHPWRALAAVLAIMLGVALALAVQLINASAFTEFAQATRAASGQSDLQVRARQGRLPEALFGTLVQSPLVARANPVLEARVQAGAGARQSTLRLVAADTLALPAMAPALMPRPWPESARTSLFAPATVFLNASALQALGLAHAPATVQLQAGLQRLPVAVAGSVAAGGAPLAVMDIGAAQDLLGQGGWLSRVDLQLAPGVTQEALLHSLELAPGQAGALLLSAPQAESLQMDQLSRAYRVNLTVLALIALFTGAYLVFSVQALAVARRQPQFALLAVLGATPRQRLWLVLCEATALGLAASLLGVLLGALLAALALRLAGGDLGGGYFSGTSRLHWSNATALAYALLGLAAAWAGAWWPARSAQRLPPAQTLKGLGMALPGASVHRLALPGLAMLAASALLAQAPPLAGMALGAYASVALLLVGGIALLPWLTQWLLGALAPWAGRRALALLALERARRTRGATAATVGGVVAALSLAVALTVMVTSFRQSVTQWLDAMLPAPAYLRAGGGAQGDDGAVFSAALVQALEHLPQLQRVQALRTSSVRLSASLPPLAVLARPLDAQPERKLPLAQPAVPVPAGRIPLYVSEAVVDLYGVRPGQDWPAFSEAFRPQTQSHQAQEALFFIAGVWRDYVRQTGAVVMPRADFVRLSGDERASELALWPAPGSAIPALHDAVMAEVRAHGGTPQALEFSRTDTIRAHTLRLFDRSFAVTYWLQAVAVGIGLFGVAASLSAQVLARRKEFGLLTHLGLTRWQILAVVTGEGTAWMAVGAAAGTALGLLAALVLVRVVNPQSFHWSMDMVVPWARLALLAAAVVAAGAATAWLAGRAAAGRDAVLAVKEDW